MTNTAIILAAGLGSRLQPLTDSVPKCLTEVMGKPILEQQLGALAKNGITTVAVVYGYLGKRVVNAVRTFKDNISEVQFIHNSDYATTGTAHSLWLARDYLKDGCLIVEGDVVFEPSVLPHVLKGGGSAWLARRAQVGDDGCILTVEDGLVKGVRVVNEPCSENVDSLYKSHGIVRVSTELGQRMVEELPKYDPKAYDDDVMDDLLGEYDIRIADVSGLRCQEIDTRNDLLKAEYKFTQRKCVVVILDGAADNNVVQLDNRTILEYADIPNLDALAKGGRTGLVQTMYPSLPLGSIVGMLGIMGYNPVRYYPNGRASFEAIAQDIYLEEDEIAFRCNSIKVDANGILLDAFHVPQKPLPFRRGVFSKFRFYPGRGYKNILILDDPQKEAPLLKLYEPHEHIGERVWDLLPDGKTRLGKELRLFVYANIFEIFPWSPSSWIKAKF